VFDKASVVGIFSIRLSDTVSDVSLKQVVRVRATRISFQRYLWVLITVLIRRGFRGGRSGHLRASKVTSRL